MKQPISTLPERPVTKVTLVRAQFQVNSRYVPAQLGCSAVGLVAVRALYWLIPATFISTTGFLSPLEISLSET